MADLPSSEKPFTPQLIEDAVRQLEGKSPQDVLRWAVKTFFPKLTMSTAFQAGGNCLTHMLAEIEPRVRIYNLDTGYQFKETLEMRERIMQRYGIEVEFIRPELTVAEYERKHGQPLYNQNPNQCCLDRKIIPQRKALRGYQAYLSAIRKDQTAQRGQTQVVQWDPKFELIKISPLLTWTKKDVWNFITKNDVPYNPLYDQGYTSIGCWPCTEPVASGDDERAGRWKGSAKNECGLHVIEEQQQGSGI